MQPASCQSLHALWLVSWQGRGQQLDACSNLPPGRVKVWVWLAAYCGRLKPAEHLSQLLCIMHAPTNAHVWQWHALVRRIVHGCFATCRMQCRVFMHSMFLQEWGNKREAVHEPGNERSMQFTVHVRATVQGLSLTNSHPLQSQPHLMNRMERYAKCSASTKAMLKL